MKDNKELLSIVSGEVSGVISEKKLNLTGDQINEMVESIMEDVESELDSSVYASVRNINEGEDNTPGVGGVMFVNQGFNLSDEDGTYELEDGYFMVVTGIDSEDEECIIVDIYDDEEELEEEDVCVGKEELTELINSEYLIIVPDEDIEVEENTLSVRISESFTEVLNEAFKEVIGGKIKKFKLKKKEGYKRVGGKYVKLSSKQKLSMKKNAKKMAKKAKTMGNKIIKKRKKTMKKLASKMGYRKPVNVSFEEKNSNSVEESYNVLEDFDVKYQIPGGDITINFNKGDTLNVKESKVYGVRGENEFVKGIDCGSDFITKCVSSGVLEACGGKKKGTKNTNEGGEPHVFVVGDHLSFKGKYYVVSKIDGDKITIKEVESEEELEIDKEDLTGDEYIEADKDEGEKKDTNESVMILTSKSNCGYVLVSEGREVILGNRIRARAYLSSRGYTINGETLDKASHGEMVTL